MLREDTPGWILKRVHGLRFNESGMRAHLSFPSEMPTPDDLYELTARAWGVGLGLKLLTVLPRDCRGYRE